jgi:hypothetical protein
MGVFILTYHLFKTQMFTMNFCNIMRERDMTGLQHCMNT